MTVEALAPPRDRRLAEPTLDAAIGRLWESIDRHRPATCPVCGGTMEPEYGAGARPVGGRCTDCGSRLT